MNLFDTMKRWLAPPDRPSVPVERLAEASIAATEPASPPIAILSKGSITDLKRMSKFLASVGVESQLVMPPGGCGT